MYDLQGRTALVTGAAGEQGIGRAIAVRLAKEGANVVVTDIDLDKRGDWGGLPAVAAHLESLGAESLALAANISDPDQVQGMVDEAVARFGRLDIIVNNAGAPAGPDRQPIVDLPVSEWERVHAINAKGTFLCCQAAARHMRSRDGGGRIINISSVAGRQGIARYAAYCSSKFAIVGLTQVLALELGEHGITANAVCPGLTETERLAGMADGLRPEGVDMETYRQQLIADNAAQVPLGRIAQPDDVARTVAFLASDEAAYLSGLAVNVAGGAWLS
ncbi:MAG: SDR family oxidoreductase [Gemmatimonadetes bacterium]|nr:SDR family oxidoreductase [Gemmatimonadota bacterium]MBT6145133.1 SDR family oxidoreductase [Gemmatimonadota bacterium]MBT7862688.1 SDR family oxidoreductase [Gemmatimonadota bacterium]